MAVHRPFCHSDPAFAGEESRLLGHQETTETLRLAQGDSIWERGCDSSFLDLPVHQIGKLFLRAFDLDAREHRLKKRLDQDVPGLLWSEATTAQVKNLVFVEPPDGRAVGAPQLV